MPPLTRSSLCATLLLIGPCLLAGQKRRGPAASPLSPLQQQYRAVADRIIDAALADSDAWTKLAELTDRFGNRLSGSAALERAIDWILEKMKTEGLENVRGEPVMVPH